MLKSEMKMRHDREGALPLFFIDWRPIRGCKLGIQNRLAELQSQMSSGWRYDEEPKMKLLRRVGP